MQTLSLADVETPQTAAAEPAVMAASTARAAFDSSLDLKQGLEISELMDDAVTAPSVMACGPQLH